MRSQGVHRSPVPGPVTLPRRVADAVREALAGAIAAAYASLAPEVDYAWTLEGVEVRWDWLAHMGVPLPWLLARAQHRATAPLLVTDPSPSGPGSTARRQGVDVTVSGRSGYGFRLPDGVDACFTFGQVRVGDEPVSPGWSVFELPPHAGGTPIDVAIWPGPLHDHRGPIYTQLRREGLRVADAFHMAGRIAA